MSVLAIQQFAGIVVPDTPLVESAIRYARQECEPYLFNHVMRSWLFAARLGQIKGLPFDEEVVAAGTILHDITLNERFAGPRRFEVEAADLVRSFVAEAGVDERRAQLIWDSVALNSTPSIGLYKEPEVALCTAGVCLDVVGLQYEMVPQDDIARIVDPRGRHVEERGIGYLVGRRRKRVTEADIDDQSADLSAKNAHKIRIAASCGKLWSENRILPSLREAVKNGSPS